jgi:hypothetical protein
MLQNIHDTYCLHLSLRMVRVNMFSASVHKRKKEKMMERVKEGKKERKSINPCRAKINFIMRPR